MRQLTWVRIGMLAALALSVACGAGSPPPSGHDLSMVAAPDSGGADLTAAPLTWTGFAQGFFAGYCVRCHGVGNANRDYTQLAQVMRDQSLIACGVSPTKLAGCGASPVPSQFPIGNGPFPSDDERNRLVAWIQAGTP